MNKDIIYREDAIKAINARSNWYQVTCNGKQIAVMLMAKDVNEILEKVPSADRPKHYCAECKFEPIDKRCMPCSSCTNNPKNRDAFVSCEVEKKGADNE